jgi:Icc-related predicted phosphoesterase
MKLVIISDTHNRHNKITIPDGDVLIHCGDATMHGTEPELIEFNRWMGTLDFKHKLVIAGNHDWLYQTYLNKAKQIATNFTYLEDSYIIIDGLRFYGFPWQPTFFDWAFNLDRNSEEMRQKCQSIHPDTNVLISHGPAFGTLDLIPKGLHVGCEDLSLRISNLNNLMVHCFGHIHHSYGVKTIYNDDGLNHYRVNASICNESYNPWNQPIELEI